MALAERILAGRLRAEANIVKSLDAENRGDFPLALEYLHQAGSLAAPRHYANLFARLDRLDEAIEAAQAAVVAAPRSGAAYCQLAFLLREAGRLAEARDRFQRAIGVSPNLAEAYFGLGQLLLLQGEYQPGWEGYEWRYRIPMAKGKLHDIKRPQWNGMRWPEGRLFVLADQGFGDVIQFARYLPLAAERVGTLVFGTTPPLRRLLEQIGGPVLTIERMSDLPEVDVQTTLSGLLRLFTTSETTIPPAPYLSAPEDAAARWRHRLAELAPAGLLKVGVCWAGRPSHPNDSKRSMEAADLAPLAAIPNIFWFSLQKGDRAAEAADFTFPLLDLTHDLTDFAETAALVANLDLVISVDTSIIHLAGALGVPGWLLLPNIPDWRWLLDREDSPWYPSVRLFRQGPDRAWAPVIGRVGQRLHQTARVN